MTSEKITRTESDTDGVSATERFGADEFRNFLKILKLFDRANSSSDDHFLSSVTLDDTETVENALNRIRVEQYRRQFTNAFFAAIRDSEFEFGFESIADVFVRRKLRENALATKEWINEIFVNNYSDTAITSGILQVIAHIGYDDIAPQGPTMAIAATSHTSVEIQELGIRAFEIWGNSESLSALRKVEVNETWLAAYLAQVIQDIERNLN